MDTDRQPEIEEAQLEAQHLIAQIINRTGLTPSEVARHAGISPSTLTRIYPTATVGYSLSARTLAKLTAAFPLVNKSSGLGAAASYRPGWLMPKCPMVMLTSMSKALQSIELEVFCGDLEALGGPRGLATFEEADRFLFAYMPSDCMEPRIKAGEVLVIDRVLPPATMSDVIVQLGRSETEQSIVCVGQLVERSRDRLRITQLQNNQTMEFARDQVTALHAIVGRLDRALIV